MSDTNLEVLERVSIQSHIQMQIHIQLQLQLRTVEQAPGRELELAG